jgi:hypothetical protein
MALAQTATLVGVFQDPRHAEKAVAELARAGFREDQIGVVIRSPHAASGKDTPRDKTDKATITTAVAGGLGGAALGALVTLAVPEFGLLLASSLLAAAFEGATAGALAGGLVGGLVGVLVGVGIPEEDAHHYEQEVRAGRALVTVAAPQRQDEAREILLRCGARDISAPPVAHREPPAEPSEQTTGLVK